MFKKVLILLSISYSTVHAQVADSSIVILKKYPIIIQNGRYAYNLKRTSFDGLHLLLNSMDDRQIDRHMKKVNLLRDARDVIRIGVLGYGLITLKNQPLTTDRSERAANIIFGGVVATVLVHFVGKIYEAKAIRKYNSMLPELAMTYDRQSELRVCLYYRF